MSRRSGDAAYTREAARFRFMLAVRSLRPACFDALGDASQTPARQLNRAVGRWAERWGLTAEWCIRWALGACPLNGKTGQIVALPVPVEALARGPKAEGLSLGIDGYPGFLRWLQQQDLADLVRWFEDSDLLELAGAEPGLGAPQRKSTARSRLKSGCDKLVTEYLRAVEAHCSPRSFPEIAFEWLARRVVPAEAGGAVETWGDIAPGAGADDDPDNPVDESTARRTATDLAAFIELPLPGRTAGR